MRYNFLKRRPTTYRLSTPGLPEVAMRNFFALIALMMLTGLAVAEDDVATFSFEPLPYAYDALEPYIDARTMELHYNRHHRGYFTKLQTALEGTELGTTSLVELLGEISAWPTTVRNNAGGHYNHSLYWQVMSAPVGGFPTGPLQEAIDAKFGSFDALRVEFKQAGLSHFGSGWAWLCVADDGELFITTTSNQDNPLMDVVEEKGTPILGVDLWEHAYYLKFQNERGRYIDSFWNVVNWPAVGALFGAAQRR